MFKLASWFLSSWRTYGRRHAYKILDEDFEIRTIKDLYPFIIDFKINYDAEEFAILAQFPDEAHYKRKDEEYRKRQEE